MNYYADSHLHLPDLTWENLKSMYLAGIRIIVSPMIIGAAKHISHETVKDMWDYQLEVQLKRTEEHFIKSYAMLGVGIGSTPKGDFSRLFDWLAEYLKRPEVVAIGEIGIEPGSITIKDLNQQEEIVNEQLKILRKFNKAVVFHTPPADENKIKYTERLLDLCKENNIQLSKVIIDHCNDSNIKMALDSGAVAAITVQPWRGITPKIASDLIIKHGYENVIVNSDSSAGMSDPLAVPKTAYELRKKGQSEELINKVCWRNILDVYSINYG